MDERIKEIIIRHGRSLILSDEFQSSFDQVHHLNMNVGDHTLGVTLEAVRLCLSWGFTDEPTLKNVVIASLCHDLGILGRKEKFRNNAECLVRHPLDSVDVYRKLTGEDDERVTDTIRCHMFPLKPGVPKYREGWVVTFADKISASKEKMGMPPVTKEDREDLIRSAREREND